jgi:DNA repair exonuclease SbcCD nuclease subunit
LDEPHTNGLPSMVVGHQYIEDVYGEQREMIDPTTSQYDFTVMGHNHSPTVKELDNTTAIVPGSLSRLSSHEQNMTRQVFTWEIDFDTMTYEQIPIHVKPAETIFNQHALNESDNQKDIKEFVNSLDHNDAEQSFGNVVDLLDDYDLDSDVQSMTEYYLREHGIIE